MLLVIIETCSEV